jgi:hypothetical protein
MQQGYQRRQQNAIGADMPVLRSKMVYSERRGRTLPEDDAVLGLEPMSRCTGEYEKEMKCLLTF